MGTPRLSPSAALSAYEACLVVIRNELAPPYIPGADAHLRATAAELLALWVAPTGDPTRPVEPNAATAPIPEPWIKAHLHGALQTCLHRDQEVLWQLTAGLLTKLLRHKLPRDPSRQGPDSERHEVLFVKAISKLEGGKQPWQAWLSGSRERPFFAFLYVCAENAIADGLRLKGAQKEHKVWSHAVPAASTHPGTGEVGVVLAASQTPERQLTREERAVRRHELIQLLRERAMAHASDPNSKLVLAYMDWMLSLPEGMDDSQAAFARATGTNPNTVSSALRRFRARHDDPDAAALRRDVYTTQGS